ncbi:hypothetical protein GALMADRAFT_236893 [Galerina marginata CBS 339.88]|uniref:Protein kinase domain-containing protein n=1 Tax=Galerina marginata (strain CBS 339.88) TaxID=685588 RepID=A0A067TYQ1_GALM3|nr:hypothetical protein GALMADRAFT_236893 [Galerina marginata CBS 339.88]
MDDPPGKRSAACSHSDYHRPNFRLSSTSPDELYGNYGQRNINAAKGSVIVPLVDNSELEPGVQDKAPHSHAPLANISPEDLTRFIARDNLYPAHGGSYADIFCGTLSKNGRAMKVAIKVIRSHTYTEANQLKIDKRLRREIRMWCGLQHSNIVQLLGTTTDFGPYTAMVCPWMKEGNLNHYLNHRKPELNLRRRLEILKDVVEGLFYLHARSIIHGDLTTGNILMDGRTACLTDFGLSNVLAEFRTNSLTSSNVACAPRWAAPELYSVGTTFPEVTTHCDIYSFGSIALQVISGRLPYGEIKSDFVVIIELTKGRNPRRPVEPLLSDGFWNFIVLCWHQDPRRRPAIDELREKLHVLQDTCGQEALVANIVDADKMKGNP